MKKIYVLWSLAIATLCANVFFACKSDDTLEDFYRRNGFTMELVKTPDFVVYSDGNVLSSTLTTKAETRGESDDVFAEVAKQAFVDAPQYASYTVSLVYTNSNKDAIVMSQWWTNEISPIEADLFKVEANGTTIFDKYNNIYSGSTALTNITYSFNRPGGYNVPNAYKFVKVNDVYYLCLDLVWPSVNGEGVVNYAGDGDYTDWIFKIEEANAQGGEEQGQQGEGEGGGTPVVVNDNYYKVQDWENTTKDHMPAEYAKYVDKAPAKTDRGENVSQAEYDYVMAYLAEHPDEGGLTCNLTTYFIQNVGGSFFEYKCSQFPTLKDHNGASHDVVGSNHMDFVAFSKHRNDYNAVGGPRALLINVPVEDPSYHDSWGDTENTKTNAYRFYVIEFNGEKNLYLCYDYQTKKNSGEYLPGDKVFNDWVIKLIPAESDNGGGGEEIEEHITDIVPADEVEINFSVNDEKEVDDYIATKLSIHIRALTDVEVFIPVKQAYYCDVDDMAIVLSHNLDINYQYSNPGQASIQNGYTYTYTVAGEYVKDGETLTANEAINVIVTYEAEGIRVKTQGITQAALDYLQYIYHDGITIEVWNYFNSEIVNEALETIPVTRADLKPMFDQSTVSFTASDKPSQYVNAFAMLYDYKKLDLHVYMKDNKPYLLDVTTNAEGRVISETPTDNLLASQYWVANDDGTFKEFVGDKNAWDCIVSPSNEWTKVQVNNGKSPANFNEIYTK